MLGQAVRRGCTAHVRRRTQRRFRAQTVVGQVDEWAVVYGQYIQHVDAPNDVDTAQLVVVAWMLGRTFFPLIFRGEERVIHLQDSRSALFPPGVTWQ